VTTATGERPLILVSNDDGISAPGIIALADALESIGEVWVFAPERERSAISHAITLHKPLRVHETAPRRFWVSGTPADSVYVALHHGLPRPPSLVVSGINRGANMGEDVLYSGTVGAAMEGCLMGIPSLAVSLTHNHPSTFAVAAELAVRVASELLVRGLPPGILLNLNVPEGCDPSRGIRATRLGRRNYGRVVQKVIDPRHKPYYWIGGPDLGFLPVEGSDCDANHQGLASLTPVHLDLTKYELIADLATWSSTQPQK
jgi:5'-nucleotidase